MPHPQITQAQQKMKEAIAHFDIELSGVRTGRAHTGLVEHIMVSNYGSRVPLKTVATISIADKTTIMIQPWDRNLVSSVEKALQEGNLGSQPVSDGHVIRIPVPAPTGEQRAGLVKKLKEMAEQCKIQIRTIRTEAHSHLRKMKESSDITEDDFYSLEKELQGIVNGNNTSIDEKVSQKEKEITSI